MLDMLVAVVLSTSINLLLLIFLKKYFIDSTSGAQKFHKLPTPRAGGIAIYFSSLLILLLERDVNDLVLVLSALPTFLIGVIEDITKRISASIRLLVVLLNATFLVYFLHFEKVLIKLQYSFDNKLLFYLAVWLIALFIAGVTNAFNIIDGFNGLAAIVSLLTLLSLAFVSNNLGYFHLHYLCIIEIGSVLGFLVFNFPYGKIFLGDGGAYFLGFITAILSIWIAKASSEISILYPIALFMYPIFEVLFSIYRKAYLRKRSPFKPDGLHFHMLIYNFLRRKGVNKEFRNPLTSVFIITLLLPFYCVTTIFWKDTSLLLLNIFFFVTVYLAIYWKLMRNFKKGFKL